MDEDWVTRNAFEKWQDRLNVVNHDTNKIENFEGKQVYANVTMTPKKKDGTDIKNYKMKNAFPYIVSPIDYAWGDNNRIASFTVTFVFDDLETDSLVL